MTNKTRILYLSLICLPFIIGCQDVKKEWIDMLSTNGLAVVFAMFCIFVALPSFGLTAWKTIHWIGTRLDKLLDQHTIWMNSLVQSNRQMAECMVPLVDKLDRLLEDESNETGERYKKLGEMHHDIRNTHTKVDEIHRLVIIRKKQNEKAS